MRWSKFLERKFLVALGGVATGVLVAFGRQEEASTVDKILGSFISVGLSLGWIAAETSRDNTRDRLSMLPGPKPSSSEGEVASKVTKKRRSATAKAKK